jgi:hypothetical protein
MAGVSRIALPIGSAADAIKGRAANQGVRQEVARRGRHVMPDTVTIGRAFLRPEREISAFKGLH